MTRNVKFMRMSALAVVALSATMLMLTAWTSGCSTGTKSESAATLGQQLTLPATITLSVPNPLSPVAPVLVGSNSVEVSGNSKVLSGTTVAMGTGGFEGDAFSTVNDVWSRGTAFLSNNVRVNGILHASKAITSLGDAIGGTDTSPMFDPPSTLSWTVSYPPGTGSNVTVPQNATRTLSPGLYGTVNVGLLSTLNLSSGTYYLTGLSIAPQATINLNQANGPVIIYVSTNLTMGGAFVPAVPDAGPVSGPDLLIAYLGTTSIEVGDPLCLQINATCGPFNGAIIAPNAELMIEWVPGGVNTGFFAAQQVVLESNAQVTYAAPVALVAAANPAGSRCAQLLAGLVPPQDIPRFCHDCASTDDTDHDGVPDCVDGCPYDPAKTAPGTCGCGIPETDSDGDGFPDCIDPCPNDPNNVWPGQCGCKGEATLQPAGTPCTDTACPQSGATCNGAGVCGNRAACSPATGCKFFNWKGTSYWICGEQVPSAIGPDGGPEKGGTATGQTSEPGAQSACSAVGETLTRIDSLLENDILTLLLTNPLWLGANDSATSGAWRWSAPGNPNGDQFWSGGPTGSPVNGLFSHWGVGAPGSQTCASIRPGDGRWFDTNCSQHLGYMCKFATPLFAPVDGGPLDPPPGGPKPLTLHLNHGACVPEHNEDAGGLPTTLAQLQAEIDAAAQKNFFGAALPVPPDGSTCPSLTLDTIESKGLGIEPDSGAGCGFKNAKQILQPHGALDGGAQLVGCFSDQDCVNAFDSSYFCRQLKNDQTCEPPDGGDGGPDHPVEGGTCPGSSSCVQLDCPSVLNPCREVEICPSTPTSFDSGLDPTSNLDAGTYDPASMFGGALPDANPSGSYSDPPGGSGPNHTWCSMLPQHGVPNASQPEQQTKGSSGHGSPISFTFDPNLSFTVKANPLALGENQLDIHAAGFLKASVELTNFLGQHYSADIVDVGAGVHAKRCSVDNSDTTFTVLGLDILSLTGLGVPKFDSTMLYPGPTSDCNNAIANFSLWANRAKKAFRDTQQLLIQYKNAQDAGMSLGNNLCQTIMNTVAGNDVPFFPGGLHCPQNEPPEITINRFLDYLQAPGWGQISQLRQAVGTLEAKSTELLTKAVQKLQENEKFLDVEENESQTILNVPFAIGPVPMVLQIDVFAGYGISGDLDLALSFPFKQLAGLEDTAHMANPNDPNNTQGTDLDIAHVEVDVMPYASAGLSAFVGAGVDLGAFSATLGIDGAVTLGEIEAPVYAGAGLRLLEQYDPRPLPLDIAPISLGDPNNPINPVGALFHFNAPKSFKFNVWFDYGAGIQLNNILAGEIDAELNISFFFFSASWHVQIVQFSGWGAHFNLLQGGAPGTTNAPGPVLTSKKDKSGQKTNLISGTPPMGLAEQQLPLTVLTRLPMPDITAFIPDGGDAAVLPSSPPTMAFDQTALQGFFYDDLCCAKADAGCSVIGTPQCCPDYQCVLPQPDASSGTCEATCVPNGGNCKPDAAVGCCGSLTCTVAGTCGTPPVVTCSGPGQGCFNQNDCCLGTVCGDDGLCH